MKNKLQIGKYFSILNDNERNVLLKRFGFLGNPNETLNTLGQSMGISRERVRQIEAKALEKLQLLYDYDNNN